MNRTINSNRWPIFFIRVNKRKTICRRESIISSRTNNIDKRKSVTSKRLINKWKKIFVEPKKPFVWSSGSKNCLVDKLISTTVGFLFFSDKEQISSFCHRLNSALNYSDKVHLEQLFQLITQLDALIQLPSARSSTPNSFNNDQNPLSNEFLLAQVSARYRTKQPFHCSSLVLEHGQRFHSSTDTFQRRTRSVEERRSVSQTTLSTVDRTDPSRIDGWTNFVDRRVDDPVDRCHPAASDDSSSSTVGLQTDQSWSSSDERDKQTSSTNDQLTSIDRTFYSVVYRGDSWPGVQCFIVELFVLIKFVSKSKERLIGFVSRWTLTPFLLVLEEQCKKTRPTTTGHRRPSRLTRQPRARSRRTTKPNDSNDLRSKTNR